MKNIFKFILLLTFFLLPLEFYAQTVERQIFFLHGLGGNVNGWGNVRRATNYVGQGTIMDYPRRKAVCPELSYSDSLSQSSMEEATTTTKSAISDFNVNNTIFGITDNAKNFIIAHSMGGLVARNLDRRYSLPNQGVRTFGGIVTFGTPHQGALILNNKDIIGTIGSSMCSELSAGPVEEFSNSVPIIIDFFSQIAFGQTVHEKFVSLACEPLKQLVPNLFKQFTPGITNDFYVGAPKLNEINAYQSSLPKVAFWGKETQGEEFWRELSSLTIQKPDDPNIPAFQGNDDGNLMNFRNSAENHYRGKRDSWQAITDQHPWCNWFQWIISAPACIVTDAIKQDELDNIWAYQRGLNWLINANDQWRSIIGAIRFDAVASSTEYECGCSDFDYDGNTIHSWTTSVTDINDCVGNGWLQSCYPTGNTVQVPTLNYVDEASDGIVTETSAKNFPQGTSPLPTPSKEMTGSNHQQMRNDVNTKARLLELFNGIHGTYFYTNSF